MVKLHFFLLLFCLHLVAISFAVPIVEPESGNKIKIELSLQDFFNTVDDYSENATVSGNETDSGFDNAIALFNQTIFTLFSRVFAERIFCTEEQLEAIANCSEHLVTYGKVLESQATSFLKTIRGNSNSTSDTLSQLGLNAKNQSMINETLEELNETCQLFTDYQNCSHDVLAGSECKPLVHQLLEGIFPVTCSDEFKQFVLNDGDCLAGKLENNTEILECLNALNSSEDFSSKDITPEQMLAGDGFGRAICKQVDSALFCFRKAATDCNLNAVNVIGRLTSTVLSATFGFECDLERTKCEFERELVKQFESHSNRSAPTCDAQGLFEKKQCSTSNNQSHPNCSCVDQNTGEPHNKTDCESTAFTIDSFEIVPVSTENCSVKQLQAINNCTPAISFNFNARQPLSTSMNFSQAKVNETLQELKLPCEKFEEFQHCVRNITQGTKCKPFIYDITEATLGHLCKPEFLDLLKREAHCLDQLEGDQQVEKCLEMAKSATNFVKHSGPVEICRESKKGLQCFRDVAKEKQCGAGLVNSLEKLTQNSLKAIFDMSCDDLEQQFLGPPVPLIDVGNKTAKSNCFKAAKEAGSVKPTCNVDGTFEEVQCHPVEGCWCVDPHSGVEIPNTRSQILTDTMLKCANMTFGKNELRFVETSDEIQAKEAIRLQLINSENKKRH